VPRRAKKRGLDIQLLVQKGNGFQGRIDTQVSSPPVRFLGLGSMAQIKCPELTSC
jgi:hypothetical protein